MGGVLGGGGKGGGGGGGNSLSAGEIDALSQKDRDRQLIDQQNALGGGITYKKDPNAPGGVRQEEHLGAASQGIVNNALGGLGNKLDLSNDAVTKSTMDAAQKFLGPQFQQQQESMEQGMSDRGIPMGSKAYSRQQSQLKSDQGGQMNQYLLQGREQAVNEALQNRNQNLSEAERVLGMNRGQAAPNVSSQNTAGNINNAYANQQNQRQNSWQNQALGAAGSIGAGMLLSDKREKDILEKVGKTDNGLPLYKFIYKDDPEQRENIGVIAQEVEKVRPDAVKEKDGVKYVDYKEALKKYLKGKEKNGIH